MVTNIQDRPSHFRAYITVLASSVLHLSTGALMSWSSPILPKLNLTTQEESLVGSLCSLGAAPGPFVVTLCLDTIGRKGTIYILWITFLASWIILLTSQNVYIIYISRLIGGVGVGGTFAGLPVYIAEVAVSEIRGRLGSMSFLLMVIGGLVMLGIGPYVTYYTLSVYGLVIAAIFGVFFYFVPESPYYLIMKGRRKEAGEALQKLRGYRTLEKLEEELKDIEKALYHDQENIISFWEGIRDPTAIKAISIGILLMAMQQFTGGNPMSVYAQTIFEHADLNFPASYAPVIGMLCGLLFTFLPVLLINKVLGMKAAVIISGFGCSLFLGLLGLYFFLVETGVDMYNYSFLCIIITNGISLFGLIGIGTLAWPLVAEILPLAVKGIGTGICGCLSSLIGFVYLFIFPLIADTYGYSTVFWGFAVVLLLTTVLSIIFVPDTTGKTLQEIQELLSN